MKFPLVDVIWNDFYSMYGEYTRKEIKKRMKEQCLRRTTGYLVSEDDLWLAVANTVDKNSRKYTFTDIFYCLKSGVVEIVYHDDT